MKITKKIWPQYFQEIADGRKNFELRLADWECAPGDILVLQEWNPEIKAYTGREMEKEITYVLKTKDTKFFPPADIEKYGWQIIALK